MNHSRNTSKIFGLLLSVTFLGVIVRYFPLIGTEFPIGFDAGAYYSRGMWYEKCWPALPEDISYYAEADEVLEPTPLLSWLTAAWIKFNRYFGVNSFQATKVFPLLVYILISLSLFLLSKEITNDDYVAVLSVLFFSFSKYDLIYTYTGFVGRTYFSIFVINMFFLFCIKAIKSVKNIEKWRHLSKSRDYIKNGLMASLSFIILFLVQLDQAPFVLTILVISFFIASIIKSRRIERDISAGLIIPYLVGITSSIPIFYWKKEFIFGRLQRFLSTSGIKIETSFIEKFGRPLLLLSFITIIFFILGISFATKELKQSRKDYGSILIVSWSSILVFLTMFSLYVGNVLLSAHRYLAFGVIPISIIASIGFWRTKDIFQRRFMKNIRLPIPKISLTAVFVSYLFASSLIAVKFPTHSRSFFDERYTDGMNWINEETNSDSIIFCYTRSPWHLSEFIPGVTGRQIITKKHQVPSGNYSKEGELNLKTETILQAMDIDRIKDILKEYPDSYLVIGNNVKLLNDAGISLSRLDDLFSRKFADDYMIIYRLELNVTDIS